MWRLNKPKIEEAVSKDIQKLANEIALSPIVRTKLRNLYVNYDSQGGYVTDAQISTITLDDASKIYDTYSKTYDGKRLSYIRTELMQDVFKCPYCGIAQPTTLDHYLPKSDYKALAVCRMNLVPMCGVCNNYKNAKEYADFIHCYYEKFPDTIFLVAEVFIKNNRFAVKFSFNLSAINNLNLRKKLCKQEKEIRLFNRLLKESTVYISTLCSECEVKDTDSLKLWLDRRLNKSEILYGKNDWRCAILRGLLALKTLDISIIESYNSDSVIINKEGV